MVKTMVIMVPEEIEDALSEAARRHGVTPENFVLDTVRARLITSQEDSRVDPWEDLLLRIGVPAGVSLSDEAAGRESLYD